MILVNNPGGWGRSIYWPLEHAEWHGWTPTDLIFPFFLFIVGTSLSYSFRKYRNGAQVDAGRLLADRAPDRHADFPRLDADAAAEDDRLLSTAKRST